MTVPPPGSGVPEVERPDRRSSETLFLAAITVGALAVRMAALLLLRHEGLRAGWAAAYETGHIARAIASGHGFSSPFGLPTGPTAWLMPGYPSILALLFRLFGICTPASAAAALILNGAVSALTCLPVFAVSRRLFGQDAARLNAVLWALHPAAAWQAATVIWDTTLFALCLVLIIHELLLLSGDIRPANALRLGGLMGATALLNAASIAFYPFALLWLLLPRQGGTAARRFVMTALAGATAAFLLLPWVARNQRALGRPVLRSNLGVELRIGNNPGAEAFLSAPPSHRGQLMAHPILREKEFLRYQQLGELAYTDECLQEALAFIRRNPGRFVRFTGWRIREFWLREPRPGRWLREFVRNPLQPASLHAACYVVPLPFALLGAWLALRRRAPVAPLLGLLFFLPLVYYGTHVRLRYRFPIEPALLMLAGYGLHELWRRLRGARRSSRPVTAGGQDPLPV